jgi:hypothetical protein
MPRAAEPYGSGAALVFDTSAYCCPVVALELLASARDEQACAVERSAPHASSRASGAFPPPTI